MTRVLTTLTRRVAEHRDYTAARRDHDDAMTDARVGVEHAAAIDRAISRGEQGCLFCR